MSAGFTLKVRRHAGDPARYTVWYACRRGRGLISSGGLSTVREAELRSNGLLEELTAAQIMAGEFVYVGFNIADNGKFVLWDKEPELLRDLRPGPWVVIAPRPVESSPFFVLDTDQLEFERPWARKRRRRRRVPVEPVTEPGVPRRSAMSSGHSGCVDMPGLIRPSPEPDLPRERWEELEVLALPEAGLAVATKGLSEPAVGKSGMGGVVRYLREQLRLERLRSVEQQARIARLQAVIVAMAEDARKG